MDVPHRWPKKNGRMEDRRIHDRTRTNHPYCLNSRITIPTLEMNSRPKVQEVYDDDEYFDLGNDSESD
ncbi:MAG: hypothetical protein OPY06_03595 [Nitrosopumilus sp.]|nr:hypothetical protein [Nitrosopumilus sp.]MDF2422975.1 hypothetical protein [Nitrosopumilus sp.]MDF2423987.1 hypothetical protein [Nitrosopumilus sp.]